MRGATLWALLAALLCAPAGAKEPELKLSPDWEYVADTVMGGVSRGTISHEQIDGRAATRLTGTVSLDNNGGFIQMAFDLDESRALDASAYAGITFDVFGNGQHYDLRLRTTALTRPWQSFRAQFAAPAQWTTIRMPFADLTAHRTEATFDTKALRRIGILAIGQEMQADISVSSIGFYR